MFDRLKKLFSTEREEDPDRLRPQMPRVNSDADLDVVFATARRIAAGGTEFEQLKSEPIVVGLDEVPEPPPEPEEKKPYSPLAEYHRPLGPVVIVTPNRSLMLVPTPPRDSIPHEKLEPIKSLLAPTPARNVAAIAYTNQEALDASMHRCIPFLNELIGFSHIGHTVWVFEGRAEAFAAGCRNADVLIVDSGMVPHLHDDWLDAVKGTMAGDVIWVYDRASRELKVLTSNVG